MPLKNVFTGGFDMKGCMFSLEGKGGYPTEKSARERYYISNYTKENNHRNSIYSALNLLDNNEQFFIYSKEMFSENNFLVEDISNLLNNNQIENIQTEYEKKFRSQGLMVYGLIASKK